VTATTEAPLLGFCDLLAPKLLARTGHSAQPRCDRPRAQRNGGTDPPLMITTSLGLLKQPHKQKLSNVRDLYLKSSRSQPAVGQGHKSKPKGTDQIDHFGLFAEAATRQAGVEPICSTARVRKIGSVEASNGDNTPVGGNLVKVRNSSLIGLMEPQAARWRPISGIRLSKAWPTARSSSSSVLERGTEAIIEMGESCQSWTARKVCQRISGR
jgi:hypothetical protein